MSRLFRVASCLLPLIATISSLQGATVFSGYIAFNIDDPVFGQNSFVINNLTGPTFGCTDDFQICDNVSIDTGLLTVDYLDSMGMPQTLTRTLMSPALPGTTAPPNFVFDALLFTVTGASFSGTISPSSFLLNDSSTFTANPTFNTVIDIAGSGIGLFQIDSPAVGIPEPATLWLLIAAVPVLLLRRRSWL